MCNNFASSTINFDIFFFSNNVIISFKSRIFLMCVCRGVSIHSTEVDGTVRSQDEAATFVSAAGDVNVNGSLMEGIRKGEI